MAVPACAPDVAPAATASSPQRISPAAPALGDYEAGLSSLISNSIVEGLFQNLSKHVCQFQHLYL